MSVILQALKSQDAKPTKPLPGEFYVTTPKQHRRRLWDMVRRTSSLLVLACVALGSGFLGFLVHRNEARISTSESNEKGRKIASESFSSAQAEALFRKGDLGSSLQMFQRGLEQDRKNPELHNRVAVIFLKQKAFGNALVHLNRAIEYDPSCASCFNNLGHVKALLGEELEAEQYFHKSIELKEDYADPYFNLAVMWERSGDDALALRFYQKFVQYAPSTSSDLIQEVKKRIAQLERLRGGI